MKWGIPMQSAALTVNWFMVGTSCGQLKVVVQALALLFLLSGCGQQEPQASRYKKNREITSVGNQNSAISPTLGWLQAINSQDLGLNANPMVDGKTLAQIITSVSAGRDDGELCSACHNNNEDAGGYGVNVDVNGASPNLRPTDMISGRVWASDDGWAVRFVRNNTKPENLKLAIQAWINSGWQR